LTSGPILGIIALALNTGLLKESRFLEVMALEATVEAVVCADEDLPRRPGIRL
jgi:hypothetical protein